MSHDTANYILVSGSETDRCANIRSSNYVGVRSLKKYAVFILNENLLMFVDYSFVTSIYFI